MSQHAVGGWFYTDGGTLPPDDPAYVIRQADTDLFSHIRASNWCYVLTSRQMGKSSLMARTAFRLQAEKRCTPFTVDLTSFTEQTTLNPESWYLGFANQIARQMDLSFDVLKFWWREHAELPAVQRLTQFLEDVVLVRVPGDIVVFVDEIDVTLNLTFKDDFFAALRSCYNARAVNPKWIRLTFVLLGVASPAQLISDPTRTPFNIGNRIDLTDFTPAEARPLAAGLDADPVRAQAMLDRVLHWTGGHPFLTQSVCHAVARQGASDIDAAVGSLFFHPRALQEKDGHIGDIGARLKLQGPRALALYRRVLRGAAVRDEPASPLQIALKLAGIVRTSAKGTLIVRNRIYQTVFSEKWLREAAPSDWRLPASVAALLLSAGLLAYLLPQQQIRTLQIAQEQAVIDDAYRALRRWPWHRAQAEVLYARYWERLGRGNEALLSWLRAAAVNSTAQSRRAAASLMRPDLPRGTTLRVRGATAAAFSGDGKTVATGDQAGLARLWRTEDGLEISDSFQLGHSIASVAIHPSGRQLLASGGGLLKVWDIATRELIPLYSQRDESCPDCDPNFSSGLIPFSICAVFEQPGSAVAPSCNAVTFSRNRAQAIIARNSADVFVEGSLLQLRQEVTGEVFSWDLNEAKASALLLRKSPFVALSFQAGEKHFGLATRYWFELHEIGGGTAVHQFSRHLEAQVLPGGLRLADCPNCFDIALRATDESVIVKRLALDLSDVEPVQGDPQALLAEWEEKLNLHFDDSRLRFLPIR